MRATKRFLTGFLLIALASAVRADFQLQRPSALKRSPTATYTLHKWKAGKLVGERKLVFSVPTADQAVRSIKASQYFKDPRGDRLNRGSNPGYKLLDFVIEAKLRQEKICSSYDEIFYKIGHYTWQNASPAFKGAMRQVALKIGILE